MNLAVHHRVRDTYAQELYNIQQRLRSKDHDPRAPRLEPRPFEKWERLLRAEEAQRVVGGMLRDKLWCPDPKLDQWVEHVWCMDAGMAAANAAGSAPPIGPNDVLGAAGTIIGFITAELGITIATGVSAWATQLGSAVFDHVQGTAGAQPAFSAADATIWGRATVTGDGTSDFMTNTWDPPTPGTTPAWFRFVFKPITFAANRRLVGGLGVIQAGAVNQMRCTNGTNGGLVAAALGTWSRAEALFNNSTTDYLKIGSTTSTGTNFGNTNVAANAVQLFAGGSTNFGNYALRKWMICNAEPTALQKAILDGMDNYLYNGNITL